MRPDKGIGFFANVLTITLTSAVLTACGGGGGNGDTNQQTPPASVTDSPAPTDNGTKSGTEGIGNLEQFFAKNIQANLTICRTCHIPGGVADTDTGKRFMLSTNAAEDYANLKASWTRLGGGVETNAILVKNADAAAAHSGGQNWPVGSKAYKDMATLFQCWSNPNSCTPSTT
ncbi:MAG TPA: hypothetical protein VFM46_00085, partial [Pseudomonadales bacterium]|nr:hypothetical protein [Pseudomonadales bacterium]